MTYLEVAIQNARIQFGMPEDDETPPPPPVVDPRMVRQCCAEFASVIACDGDTDVWRCPVCSHVWDAPCR